MENFIDFPMIDRDENGFMSSKNQLRFENNNQIYSKCNGMQISNNNIIFLFEKSNGKNGRFDDDQDIKDILHNNICSSEFSLETYSKKYPYIYKLEYKPKILRGTNFLGTLMHTDYI
jgi:hypothetical protein